MSILRLGFLLGLVIASPAFSNPDDSVYLRKNLYLVAAKTVELGTREVAGPEPKAKIPEAKFEITKVYAGPDWLKKYSFTWDLVPYQISVISPMDRLHINVGFEKGSEGLWWVSYNSTGKGTVLPVRTAGFVDEVGIRPFPYQKMLSDGVRIHKNRTEMEASYKEGLAWAEAVEKVYKAKTDKERAELLRGYASENTPRSQWAIASLAQSGDKNLTEFFRKLIADDKQLIENQVMLERALVIVDNKDWTSSEARRTLHERWDKNYPLPMSPICLQVLEAEGKWGKRRKSALPFGGFGP